MAVVALALISLACPARADEYGPHPAIRAIRGALPVLLARYVKAVGAGDPVTVHGIVIQGDIALTAWSAGNVGGLVILAHRSNGWWVTGEAHSFRGTSWWYGNAGIIPFCNATAIIGPTSEALVSLLGLNAAFARLAAAHIPEIAQADTTLATYRKNHPEDPKLFNRTDFPGACYPLGKPSINDGRDGFQTSWTFPGESATIAATAFTFHDRAPTESEMPPSRGADAVYFFTLQSNVGHKVSVGSGSTLDVWAPFVLDPHLRYTLTLALGDPTIGPLAGTVSDNTMHFTLPAFSAPPSVELMGEIDADP